MSSLSITGTSPGAFSLAAGIGSIAALAANSGGFAAPATGGTAYLIKLPATVAAGIPHLGTPGTVDGVNESAMTVSAITTGDTDNTIAKTGVDINTSNQVTATHLASPLPVAQGGTANSYFTVSGPASTAKTYTFPNANATMAYVVASGASALNTSAISSASHNLTTVSATGVLTTDTILATVNGSIIAITGYVPATAGMLSIYAYPTADNVNFDVINNTSGAITPGAVTVNWKVIR